MLFDCYHMQIMEGDLVSHIKRNIDVIGHFHSAGVPGRHELFTGETNYPFSQIRSSKSATRASSVLNMRRRWTTRPRLNRLWCICPRQHDPESQHPRPVIWLIGSA